MTLGPIERFVALAEQFRALVGGASGIASPSLCRDLVRSLAELCIGAVDLPEVERSDRQYARAPRRTLTISFGAEDHYREVFNGYEDDDPVIGSLIDDLQDIDHDLACGLAIARGGTNKDLGDAAWEWRMGFFSHWGEHATSALRALYWLMQRDALK